MSLFFFFRNSEYFPPITRPSTKLFKAKPRGYKFYSKDRNYDFKSKKRVSIFYSKGE